MALWRTAAVCAALALALDALTTAAAPAADIDPDVRRVLARDLRFSTSDLNDLERDKVVKHSIDSQAPGEVAVAGGVRVNASKYAFIARVRDIERFKRIFGHTITLFEECKY